MTFEEKLAKEIPSDMKSYELGHNHCKDWVIQQIKEKMFLVEEAIEQICEQEAYEGETIWTKTAKGYLIKYRKELLEVLEK